MQKLFTKLEELVAKTYNTDLRIQTTGKVWTVYLVKSKNIYKGPLVEVLQKAIDDIEKNTVPSNFKNKKNQKFLTYKPKANASKH